MGPRARGAAGALLGVSLCLLGACGSEPGGERPRVPSAPQAAATLLVLDPEGRLLDIGEWALVFACRGGLAGAAGAGRVWSYGDEAPPLFTFAEVPAPDTEFLVLADGCVPLRTRITAGRNVARLERGFLARIEVEGPDFELPPGAYLGLALELSFPGPEGCAGVEDACLRPVATEVFDFDTPRHPERLRLYWPRRKFVDLYVPVEGAYELMWNYGRGNTGMGGGEREPVLLEPDAEPVRLTLPAWVRTRAEQEKGR